MTIGKIKFIISLFLGSFILSSCYLTIPRCKIDACHVRQRHIHRGVEFRGLPWYYLNQNPKTGEGYPEIINKKKNY